MELYKKVRLNQIVTTNVCGIDVYKTSRAINPSKQLVYTDCKGKTVGELVDRVNEEYYANPYRLAFYENDEELLGEIRTPKK